MTSHDEKTSTIYSVPTETEQLSDNENIIKCDACKPSGTQTAIIQEKVIMMVGGTGVGKTTLINRMVNHLFGVEFEEDYRCQLIVEDESKDQTISQTKKITVYTLHKSVTVMPYVVKIIDTPGFGDTGGKDEDTKTAALIKHLFDSRTITALDAIGFVVKYNEHRLTETQKYIFQSVVKTFGKDVQENIFIFATFCDDPLVAEGSATAPNVVQALNAASIPYQKVFEFNNINLYTKARNLALNGIWDMSKKSFESLFLELNQITAISLNLTKELLGKKEHVLTVQLPQLIQKIHKGTEQMHVLRQEKRVIEAHEADINENKEFSYTVEEIETQLQEIVAPNVYATRCRKCNKECHFPCTIAPDGSLRWCKVMSWVNIRFEVYCTICQCSWEEHESSNQVLVKVPVKRKHTKDDLKKKYEVAVSSKITHAAMVDICKKKVTDIYADLLKDFEEVQNCIDFINENALSTSPISLEDYVNDLIEREEENKQDGYEEQIKCYKKLLKIKMEKRDERFKTASQAEKTKEAINFLES